MPTFQSLLVCYIVFVRVTSAARSCAARDDNNKDNVCESSIPAGLKRPPPSKTIPPITRFGTILNTLSVLMWARALDVRVLGVLHVGVDVEARDTEVDVIYIPFIVSV